MDVSVDIDALRLKYGIRYGPTDTSSSQKSTEPTSETKKKAEIKVLVDEIDEVGRLKLIFDPPEVSVPQNWPALSD